MVNTVLLIYKLICAGDRSRFLPFLLAPALIAEVQVIGNITGEKATAATRPIIAIIGARSPIRISITRKFWITDTSVVFLVISDALPNLSTSDAEKS